MRYYHIQLVVNVVAIEADEEEGQGGDGGDGQLEVAAPRQQGGCLTQAEETTWGMAIVVAC